MPLLWLRNSFISWAHAPPETSYYIGHVQFNKTTLSMHDGGLVGIAGAFEIIRTLNSQPTIHRLTLGNNELGDDGAVTLFEYLASSVATHLSISEISLNSCRIGNRGLDALSRYIAGNGRTSLKALYLQNNEFKPSWSSISLLTSALNLSRVKILSFNTNPQLSDDFVFRFLPNLRTPHLHQLHLSAIGITPFSNQILIDFLTVDRPKKKAAMGLDSTRTPSPKSLTTARVRDLRLNGNKLNLDSIRQIVKTLRSNNFSLLHLEIFANDFDFNAPPSPPVTPPPASPVSVLTEGDDDGQEEGQEDTAVHSWQTYNAALVHTFARNQFLTARTSADALRLLSPSRVLILPPNKPKSSSSPARPSSRDAFRWHDLPTELQLHILTFIAPNLSPSQRVRIWHFAADRATLPALHEETSKEDQRGDWLECVGCDRFEWYPGWTTDFSAE